MTDEMVTYRRTELYEEIWREPVRTVAQRYGVSDVGLRKICRKLRVPLPGRGHWIRMRLGKEGRRPPLPLLQAGELSEVVRQKRTRPVAQSKPEPADPPIAVPAELRNPHRLVSEASGVLKSRDPRDGLVHCWGTSRLDIAVAPASLGRALRIMNALIRALEERSLPVEVTRPLTYEQNRDRGEDEPPSNVTRVLVSGEWIQFGLSEKRSKAHFPKVEPPKGLRGSELESWIWRHQERNELVPNGVLELAIKDALYRGARTVWHDGKRKRLEDQLGQFVAHLPIIADAIKRKREEMLRFQLEYQEKESHRFEEERRRLEESERIRRFEEELHRWRLARDAREYIAEVREIIAAGNGAVEERSQLEERLKWAGLFAERVDPLTRIRENVARRPIDDPVAVEAGEDASRDV